MSGLPDIDSIFCAAIEIESSHDRDAYIEAACAGNTKLKNQLDRLLRAHFRSSILDLSSHDLNSDLDEPLVEKPGDTIGPYKLLELIGEGGMGLVYMAEQQTPVNRIVALKIIKPGMDTRQVMARFEAERQALALMDHGNIARVFDANTTESGHPYFVMELVKGKPIIEYCDSNNLNLSERLQLFISVCHAIQHAHQKGIIHRDIKPANVLVALYDGQPVPKVIDFGIAKAIQQKLTDKTMYTSIGQILGTLEYMSPEQAEVNQRDIDTRSDVYSLGVLLYELLTGSTPITREQLRDVGFEAALRAVRETEPAKPSNRVSESRTTGHTTLSIRDVEPAHLSRLTRGDLDWIAMKALEKSRDQRYQSAGDLARDIERYLANEPVEAGPHSFVYSCLKFYRRHRKTVLATATLLGILTVCVVVSTWQWIRAYRADVRGHADRLRAEIAEQKSINYEQTQRLFYFNRIVLADRELQSNNIARCKELLADCPEQLRGWEWSYLNRISGQEAVLLAHQNPVNAVVLSPDGKLLASGASDGKNDHVIHIYELESNKRIHRLSGHTMPIQDLVFSPDSRRVVSTASWGMEQDTGEVKVWDVQSGQHIGDFRNVNHSVGALAVSPDGKHVAIANGFYSAPAITIWKLENQDQVHVLRGTGPFIDLAYSPDGRNLAAGGMSVHSLTADAPGEFRIWDMTTTTQLLEKKTLSPVIALAYSRDGKSIATGGGDPTIRIWDVTTGEESSYFPGGAQEIRCLDYITDDILVSSGVDCSITLRTISEGTSVTLRGHSDAVVSLAVSKNGPTFASASDDGTVRIWDARDEEPITFLGHRNAVTAVTFSSDGTLLASKSDALRIWNSSGLAIYTSESGKFHGGVHDLAFSSDGKRIAIPSKKGTILMLDATTGRKLFETDERHAGIVTAVAFSPDGIYLASMSTGKKLGQSGEIRTWMADTGKPILRFDGHRTLSYKIGCLKYTQDGTRLVTACSENVVRVWSAKTGQQTRVLEGHSLPVLSVAVSPDNERIATCSDDNDVRLWSLRTGKTSRIFRGHTHDVINVVFSPDGRRLVSGANDRLVKVWDVESGDEIISLRGNTAKALGLAFSPDGQRIASGGQDGVIRIWNANRHTSNERSRLRAARLVNRLAQNLVRDDVLSAINSDKRLDVKTRQHAQQFATLYHENGNQHFEASLRIVTRKDASAADYENALRLARSAARLVPDNISHSNMVGMALYRTGDHEAAVERLTGADRSYVAEGGAGVPWNLAYLAMAHFRLGDTEKAHETLLRLNRVMTSKSENAPDWTRVKLYRDMFEEAKELLGSGIGFNDQ